MRSKVLSVFCFCTVLTALCSYAFQPGDYVYYADSPRSGSRVFAAVVVDGKTESGKILVASLRTQKIRRNIPAAQLKPLGLGVGATEFECQQQLLAELYTGGIRSAKGRALKKLLEELFPGDARTRNILKLHETMEKQELDQKKKFRELAEVLQEIERNPEADNRHQLNTQAEALRDELVDFGRDADKRITEALEQQDFWVAVAFSEQLDKTVLQMLRTHGRTLQNTDQKDLHDSVLDRESAVVKALKKDHLKRTAEFRKAAQSLPSSQAWWNRPSPRDATELRARMAAAVKAWHDLAALSILAEPDLWCDAAMEVVSLLPRGCGNQELRVPLDRELKALAPPPAEPNQEKEPHE